MLSTLEVRPDLIIPSSLALTRPPKSGPATRNWPSGGIISLEGLIQDFEASWQRGGPGWERRQKHRYAFEQSVQLVPLDEQSEQPVGSALVVKTQDISASGIGFQHRVPLPYKKVALTLVPPGGTEITVVTRLLWCRFTREGHYETGGQFVRCSDPQAG